MINDPEEAALMAQIIGMQNNVGQATGRKLAPVVNNPEVWEAAEGVPPEGQDLGATGTGGGNIGTGAVPQSGETEFSG